MGVVGGAYLYTIYILCYVKVGKLGFCEHGFSNCACFKNLYLYERWSDQDKSHGQGTSMFSLIDNIFFVHKKCCYKEAWSVLCFKMMFYHSAGKMLL